MRLRERREARQLRKVVRVIGVQVGERSRLSSSSLKLEGWRLHWRRKRWGQEEVMALAWEVAEREGGKVFSQSQVEKRFTAALPQSCSLTASSGDWEGGGVRGE